LIILFNIAHADCKTTTGGGGGENDFYMKVGFAVNHDGARNFKLLKLAYTAGSWARKDAMLI